MKCRRELDSLHQFNVDHVAVTFVDAVHGHGKPPIQADVLHLGDVQLSQHLSGKCTDIISLGTGLLGRHALLAGSWRVDVSIQIVDLLFFNVSIYIT